MNLQKSQETLYDFKNLKFLKNLASSDEKIKHIKINNSTENNGFSNGEEKKNIFSI